MDITLLLEPQAKHQRMHRGDSMYDEQSIIELETIRCQHCKRPFAPSSYVKHCNSGKPRCINVKKRLVYDSTQKRILNNQYLTTDEKRKLLRAIKKKNSKTRFSLRRKSSAQKRNWRDESSNLRAAVSLIRAKRVKKSMANHVQKKAKLDHLHPNECIYNLI